MGTVYWKRKVGEGVHEASCEAAEGPGPRAVRRAVMSGVLGVLLLGASGCGSDAVGGVDGPDASSDAGTDGGFGGADGSGGEGGADASDGSGADSVDEDGRDGGGIDAGPDRDGGRDTPSGPDGGDAPDCVPGAGCEDADDLPDVALRILETSPADGGELREVGQRIQVRFNQALDPVSVSRETVRVELVLFPFGVEAKDGSGDDGEGAEEEPEGSDDVERIEPAWEMQLEEDGHVLRFVIDDAYAAPWQAWITLDGVQSLAGEPLRFAWNFTLPLVLWDELDLAHRVQRSYWLGDAGHAIPVVRSRVDGTEQLDVVIAAEGRELRVVDDRTSPEVLAWDAATYEGALILASVLKNPDSDWRELRVERIDVTDRRRTLLAARDLPMGSEAPSAFRFAMHPGAEEPVMAFAWITDAGLDVRIATAYADMADEAWRNRFTMPVGTVARPEGLNLAFDPEGRLHLAMASCINDSSPCFRTTLARWRHDRGLWTGGDRQLLLPITAASEMCDELLAMETEFDAEMNLVAAILHRPCGATTPPVLWVRRAAWARDWVRIGDESAVPRLETELSSRTDLEVVGLTPDLVAVRIGSFWRVIMAWFAPATNPDDAEVAFEVSARAIFGRLDANLVSIRQATPSGPPLLMAHDPERSRLFIGRLNPLAD